jgi:hypothetical protein
MVIAKVRGLATNDNKMLARSVIEAGDAPQTYVLDAYCTDFEKENPSPETKFGLGAVDPVLACILSAASGLSQQTKQAAVWICAEKATFDHVNKKFKVSQSEWDAAAAIVKKCSAN